MTDLPPFLHPDDAPGKTLILREALRLFARDGLSATSIRDIAQATGLSNPALYKHFRTKDALALVLFERLYGAHLLQLTKATARCPEFPGKFSAFIETRLSAFDSHPDAALFMTDTFVTLWPQMPAQMKTRTILSLLRDIVGLGRTEGHVDTTTDAALQMSLVVGSLDHLTRQIAFGTLPGPATAHLKDIEQLLRKALT